MKILTNYSNWFFKRKSYLDLCELLTGSIGLFIILQTDVFNISINNLFIPILLMFITLNSIFLIDDIHRKIVGTKNRDIPLWGFGTMFAIVVVFSSVLSI